MQALLAKVINLRDTRCIMAREMAGQKPPDMVSNARGCCTDDNQRGCGTSDIRPSAGGLQPFEVPARGRVRAMNGNMGEHQGECELTNLMATV